MSISGGLDTVTLVADKVSDQFRTVESSRQLDDEEFVKDRSSVMGTQSEGDLNLNEKVDWSMRDEIGKGRRSTLHVGWNTNHPSQKKREADCMKG